MKENNKKLLDDCFIFIEEKKYVYKELEIKINDELFEKNLCYRKGDTVKFKFVGFMVSNNELIIIFPKTYSIPKDKDELKKQIKVLAEVLLRYRNEGEIEEKEKELLGSSINEDNNNIIATSLWLINDYQEYGFIKRKKDLKKVGQGNNIDWANTVKNKQPVFSNGSPHYLNHMVKKSSIDYSNILYLLHRYVVQQSYKKYGWIINSNFNDKDPSFDVLPCELNLAEYTLKKELKDTFVEREINLINTIREFILGSDKTKEKTEIEIFGTPYFHNIWENICSFVFQSKYDSLKKSIPQPQWYYDGQDKSRRQIPDILYQEDDILFILDAKYYNTNNSLPGWHDLVKQFYYFYSMKQKTDNVENILIFPKSLDEDKRINYFGYVDIEQQNELGEVYAFCIDIYIAMYLYSDYNSSNDFRALLKKNLYQEKYNMGGY